MQQKGLSSLTIFVSIYVWAFSLFLFINIIGDIVWCVKVSDLVFPSWLVLVQNQFRNIFAQVPNVFTYQHYFFFQIFK